MTTVELGTMPALSSIGAVRASLRRSRPAELPDKALVVRDVQATVEHLSAYDRACGFRLTDQLPVTYPHVLAFPLAMALMTDAAFPFPAIGTVHIGNAISQTRPILLSEAMTLAVSASGLRAHDRGQQFDIVTTATVGGAEVWRDASTYLRRSPATSAAGSSTSAAPIGGALWRVDRSVGTDYASASGDHNPIHTSRIGARAFGFPGPIAHGMWTMARAVSALEGRLPSAYAVNVAFKRPIRLGSTVAFRADATAFGWSLSVTSPKSGEPHLTGTVVGS